MSSWMITKKLLDTPYGSENKVCLTAYSNNKCNKIVLHK